MKGSPALALGIAVSVSVSCSAGEPAFVDRTITCDGVDRRYQVYLPAGHTPSKTWPVVLFLHGAGERGRDGVRQTQVGLGPAVRQHPARFPSVIVFPQVDEEETWHGAGGRRARAALARTIAELNGDPSRTYVVGLSMGGFGAWEIALDDPDLFAAMVTVSAGLRAPPPWDVLDLPIDAEDPYAVAARRVRGTPVWLFHGSEDTAIPVTEARRLHAALTRLASPVRYTEYAGQAHRIWDQTFADAELWRWLFSQRRRGGSGRDLPSVCG